MKTLSTDIGELTLRPVVIDDNFGGYIEGVEIKNEDGETVEVEDYCINEITDKSAVGLFIAYSID